MMCEANFRRRVLSHKRQTLNDELSNESESEESAKNDDTVPNKRTISFYRKRTIF